MSVTFTVDDYDFLSECLRLAQIELLQTAQTLSQTWPTSAAVETLRQWAERAADVRERIERR